MNENEIKRAKSFILESNNYTPEISEWETGQLLNLHTIFKSTKSLKRR